MATKAKRKARPRVEQPVTIPAGNVSAAPAVGAGEFTFLPIWDKLASLEIPAVHPLIAGIALYIMSFAILSYILYSTEGFLSLDDYYHARAAAEIIEQGRLRLDFPWLPLTILDNEHFVNHHLLYHMVIAPFSYLWGINGAKAATIGIAAGIPLAMYVLLRSQGVKYAFLWSFGMFGLAWSFTFRILMARTQGGAVLLLVIALYLLLNRRYRWLIPLSFAMVWLYNGFIILPVLVVIYAASVLVIDNRLEWRPVAFCIVGTVLGLVINPYFPNNITFVTDHLGAKVLLEESIPLGAEWQPLTTRVYRENALGAIVAFALGVFRHSFGKAKRDSGELTLLLFAVVTMAMSFYSLRFIEYSPPFSLLFCALVWGKKGVDLSKHPITSHPLFVRFQRILALAALAFAVTFFSVRMIGSAHLAATQAQPIARLEGAGNWLRENTPPGSLVFSTGFNDFARLLFFNTQNYYVIGLDPTYLQYKNAEHWNKYYALIRGRVENPSKMIRDTFGAYYVIGDANSKDFNRLADQDPDMERVFKDDWNIVWRIKGAPTLEPSE